MIDCKYLNTCITYINLTTTDPSWAKIICINLLFPKFINVPIKLLLSYTTNILAEYRNQRYERKRGYASLPSTPKNNFKTEQERTCHSELPRKRRAAAISAGEFFFIL